MLPPAPAHLSPQELKRRHIIAAIVESENSYVDSLLRLVHVSSPHSSLCNLNYYIICMCI